MGVGIKSLLWAVALASMGVPVYLVDASQSYVGRRCARWSVTRRPDVLAPGTDQLGLRSGACSLLALAACANPPRSSEPTTPTAR